MASLILVRGTNFPRFRKGSVTFHAYQTVRVLTFDPVIDYYRGTVAPEDVAYKPLNFRKGRIATSLRYGTKNLLLTSSPEVQFVSGRISFQLTGLPDVGALTDFAIYPDAAIADPADLLVTSVDAPVTGGVQQPWSRTSAVFAPSKSARYLGVGAKVLSVPTSGEGRRQYLKKVQVEKAYVGGAYPSSYEPARQVNVVVRPDRINLVGAPPTALSNVTLATGVTYKGETWTRATATAAGSVVRQSVELSGLRNGETYTIQWRVANDGADPVTLRIDWADLNVKDFVILPGTGQVISTSGTRPAGYDSTYRFGDLSIVGSSGSILFKDVMVEKGAEVLPYFNGSTNVDTLWEGDPGTTRSYYYKNRADRYAAIKRILEDNVPMGIGIGDPVFATLPADW